MPTLTANNVLATLSKEKLGFKFGTPQRVDEELLSVIVPIIRKTSQDRGYYTYPEATKGQVVTTDTGDISQMKVSNLGELPLFIRSGTLFVGGTQERTVLQSTIVEPGEPVVVRVNCVHASKGINPGSKVTYGGVTPNYVDARSYRKGFSPPGQGDTWRNVSAYSTSLTGGGDRGMPTNRAPEEIFFADDLVTSVSTQVKDLENILGKVKRVKHQVGMSLVTDRGCEAVELFDVAKSWKAFHKDAIKRVGSEVNRTDEEGVFQYNPEKAVAKVRVILDQGYDRKKIYEHKPNNGDSHVKVCSLSASGFTGETVEMNGLLIHLLLFKLLSS